MNMTKEFQFIYTDNFTNTNKKKFIKDLYLAFISQNVDYILNLVEDDIQWHIIDMCSIKGKEMFAITLKQMTQIKIKTLHFKHIIINDRVCAINGIAHSYDHTNYSFCDIIEFSSTDENAKIKKMSSYTNSLLNEISKSRYH